MAPSMVKFTSILVTLNGRTWKTLPSLIRYEWTIWQPPSVCRVTEREHLSLTSSPSLTEDDPATAISAGWELAVQQTDEMSGGKQHRHAAFTWLEILTNHTDRDDVDSFHSYLGKWIIFSGVNAAVISTVMKTNCDDEGDVIFIRLLPLSIHPTAVFA